MLTHSVTQSLTHARSFAETGVGGGAGQDGLKPAESAAEAARRPYFGVQGPHSDSKDPFDMSQCNELGVCSSANEIRDYRRYFYEEFSQYLLGQGDCLYDDVLEVVYLWATGSFDVLELYVPDRGYGDVAVVDTLLNHNAIARARSAVVAENDPFFR